MLLSRVVYQLRVASYALETMDIDRHGKRNMFTVSLTPSRSYMYKISLSIRLANVYVILWDFYLFSLTFLLHVTSISTQIFALNSSLIVLHISGISYTQLTFKI